MAGIASDEGEPNRERQTPPIIAVSRSLRRSLFNEGKNGIAASLHHCLIEPDSGRNALDVPASLAAFRDHMMELPSVKTAMTHEGLI